MAGISSRHGGHHVAQKFRKTTLPRYWASRTTGPPGVASVNGAAGWSSLALVRPSAVNGSSAAPAPRTSARATRPRIAAATRAGPTRWGMVAFPAPIRYGVSVYHRDPERTWPGASD